MNILKRFFDMRQIHARLFVVASLIVFSVVAWLGLRQSVLNYQQARIDEEIQNIEEKIDQRMLVGANALQQVKTFLSLSTLNNFNVRQADFEEFATELQVYDQIPGLWAMGFAQIVTAQNQHAFERAMKSEYEEFKIHPEGISPTKVVVRLMAPIDTRTARGIGFDFASDQARADAIDKSLEKDNIQFTPPVKFIIKLFDQDELGFVGFLPVYSSRSAKFPLHERQQKALGYAFLTFRAREFFEGMLGMPDVHSEKITFEVTVTDKGKESTLYRRFDLPDIDTAGPVRVRKSFNSLVSGWSISARALPGAFNILESDLHNLFALSAGSLIFLIWWGMQNSVSEIRAEETSRQQLVDSEKRVKEYSHTLLKLNLSIRNLLSEISLDKILPAVAANLADGLQADAVAIYLREALNDPKETKVDFVLRHVTPGTQNFDFNERIALAQIWELTQLRDVLYANANDEIFKSSQVFVRRGQHKSFVILPFIDQAESAVGFAFVCSNSERVDDEFLDSYLSGLIKPIGVALKNSQLYMDAQEAAHSKTTFLANMSHEIRTPLGAIVGFSDLLCQEGGSKYSSELKQNIQRNSKLLTRIIDDILDFSKFELSQPVLSFKAVNLAGMVAEVQAVVLMLAQEKNISFKFEMLPGLPEYIETDDVRMKQILLNLIGNAVKFTDHGHVVVEVAYNTEDTHIRFKISDTGSGMTREVRERLFQPFSQGDNKNTRRFGGTGLGLVLSRKLAQALGGNVRLIYSEIGRGSIFEFDVPTRAQEAADFLHVYSNEEVNSEADIVDALAEQKVLLVEDSVDNQEIFTLFLQKAGATVDLAKSGDEALIKAATSDYDIILMDIQLPIIDGKQATRILRRRGWRKPIIALTAHALEDERIAVVQAGCDGQITKPVTGTALVFAVKRYIEHSEKQIG